MSDFPDIIDLASLDGTDGSTVPGLTSSDIEGRAVSAGDSNGEGIDAIVIGSYADTGGIGGSVYVIFGQEGGFGSSFDLATLDGTNGFRVDGVGGSSTGFAVSARRIVMREVWNKISHQYPGAVTPTERASGPPNI